MIQKMKGFWVVMSEKTGRVFGRYKTKPKAVHRLQQVEFFKHLKAGTIKPKLRKPNLAR
ncbi:hypothetical protein HY065_02150 [Candidatus Berkelbacteria bacterium]|nr:hypothetical protein [Candidatus Berkelbacteria bacterium]